MTFEHSDEEGAEEAIEDLEAPADAQSDVAGGEGCGKPSLECFEPTCTASAAFCINRTATHDVIVYEQ